MLPPPLASTAVPPSSLMHAIGAMPSIARALSLTKFFGMAARTADFMDAKDRLGVPPSMSPRPSTIDANDALRETFWMGTSPVW